MHANAFGVGILDEDIESFCSQVYMHLKDFDFTPAYEVDRIYKDSLAIPSEEIVRIGDMKKLWGKGIEEPYIAIEGIKVTSENAQIFGKGVMKITLPNGISLIRFNTTTEEYAELINAFSDNYIDIVGTCSCNEWGGRIEPQIEIVDYQIVSHGWRF